MLVRGKMSSCGVEKVLLRMCWLPERGRREEEKKQERGGGSNVANKNKVVCRAGQHL